MALEGEASICSVGGSGLTMPWGGDDEQRIDNTARGTIYGIAMAYGFVGVSVVADMFMASIEYITAQVVRVPRKGSQRLRTKKVWNETVANLTLMALGSSAPEIALSCVEILKDDFYAGPLGPGTILGSASFNLLVIVAACIVAIPSSETRKIDAENVFFVTAAFSIFAYVWLLFIVEIISPNIVELWEALITLLMLPVLVTVSYACDKGWILNWGGDSGDAEPEALAVTAGDGGTGGSGEPMQCVVPSADGNASGARANSPGGSGAGGTICFAPGGAETKEVSCGAQSTTCTIEVMRSNATSGEASCRYHTQFLSAVPGYDYEEIEEGEINFADGQDLAEIELTVLPRRPGQQNVLLQIVLDDVSEGAGFRADLDGGEEECRLTLTVRSEADGAESGCVEVLDKCFNVNRLKLGLATWIANIHSACVPREDCEEADALGKFILVLMYPWNVVFNVLVPPPQFFGGWLCFVMSLVQIFLLTGVIVDLAELFGCVANVKDAVTAISFVALGTSMPDFFASKSAALSDDNADASIVNVTGSNSVNVFLGIGVPWTLAAIRWASSPPDARWKSLYPWAATKYPDGAFVVPSGDVSFSVSIFSVVAVIGLAIIRGRRLFLGGELGGPFVSKVSTAATMVALWCYFIGMSTWKAYNNVSVELQIGTAAWVLAVVLVGCALFTGAVSLACRGAAGKTASVTPDKGGGAAGGAANGSGGDEESGHAGGGNVAPTKMGWQGE